MLSSAKVTVGFDLGPLAQSWRRMTDALDELGVAFGLPSRQQRAMQARIDEHLFRCAVRRERRRKARR